MGDTADKAEVKRQALHDGSFADPPELRLLSKGGAWRKWENCQNLPPGDLKVKVISQKPGQFDAHDPTYPHTIAAALLTVIAVVIVQQVEQLLQLQSAFKAFRCLELSGKLLFACLNTVRI